MPANHPGRPPASRFGTASRHGEAGPQAGRCVGRSGRAAARPTPSAQGHRPARPARRRRRPARRTTTRTAGSKPACSVAYSCGTHQLGDPLIEFTSVARRVSASAPARTRSMALSNHAGRPPSPRARTSVASADSGGPVESRSGIGPGLLAVVPLPPFLGVDREIPGTPRQPSGATTSGDRRVKTVASPRRRAGCRVERGEYRLLCPELLSSRFLLTGLPGGCAMTVERTREAGPPATTL